MPVIDATGVSVDDVDDSGDIMPRHRYISPLISLAATIGVTTVLVLSTSGAGFAAPASVPRSAAAVARAGVAVVPATPTSNRCLNQTHTIPCWALTFHAGEQVFVCTSGVPLYDPGGALARCLGGNDLVEISCYYSGPVVSGDSYQDHVIKENAGGLSITGHIPDFYIDLNHHNPFNITAPHIPHC